MKCENSNTAFRHLTDDESLAAELAQFAKLTANWINGEFVPRFPREGKTLAESPITAVNFARFIDRISDDTLSSNMAKQVFDEMWCSGLSADEIIERDGLKQLTDDSVLGKLVEDAIAENPKAVEEFRAGKEKAINVLAGRIMKASNGKANPAKVQEILRKKLTYKSNK